MEKNSIRPDVYFMVHWWMMEKMNLRANKLLIFAFIYNISTLKRKCTLEEIIKRLSITDRTARRLIKSLFDKGYIQKEKKVSENSSKYVYWIELDKIYN